MSDAVATKTGVVADVEGKAGKILSVFGKARTKVVDIVTPDADKIELRKLDN
jgi:hypothetical protein